MDQQDKYLQGGTD